MDEWKEVFEVKKENWKDVPGYEGFYQASENGHIRSVDRIDSGNQHRKSVLMKPVLARKTGYFQVKLSTGLGRCKIMLWHRVVALTFIPNIENKRCVNHIDADKSNNKVINLEWCTHKENTHHGIKLGNITPRGEGNKSSKLKTEDVLFIRSNSVSSKQLGKKYGVDPAHITAIRRRITWKHV